MPPKLFIIFGFSGVGKSTAAEIIAKKIKVKIFATDEIRRLREFKSRFVHYQKSGKFFPKNLRRQIYRRLLAGGKKELQKGNNVIFDATFSSPWMWQLVERLSEEIEIRIIPIEIVLQKISDEMITQRLIKRCRIDKFAAKPEIYWAYKNRYQSYAQKHFVVNNDGTKLELKKQVLEILAETLK